MKLPFDLSRPISGEASVEIDKPVDIVFSFIADRFFDNYPKWATDVVDLQPLDGNNVFVGAKAKQVREDNGSLIESVFEIVEYQPCIKFIFEGVNAPYKQSYLIVSKTEDEQTKLVFRFDLSEVEIFMRPFEKLIRVAIEDGAESTVENIKNLILAECN